MRWLNVRARVFGTPLLMSEEYARVVISALADRLDVEPMVDHAEMASYVRPNRAPVADRQRGIAVVPVVGGLYHRGGGMDASSGAQSYTNLHNTFSTLFNDSVTRGLLIDGDTGGGEASGAMELSEYVVKASAESGKPVWAIANGSMLSAGYWLGAAASKVFGAKASRVGSIGVLVAHSDVSKAMEKKGVVTTLIYAGKHKVDGNPFEPLPDEVKASVQDGVDALYADFVGYVAERRELAEKEVRNTEAKTFGPEQAYGIGLIDGIGGLGDVLTAMSEELNRPFTGYTTESQVSKLLYDEEALSNARAEGKAGAVKDNETKLASAVQVAQTKATSDASKAMAAAFSTLFPDSKRAQTFCKAIDKGATVELATEFASAIDDVAPKAEVPKQELKLEASKSATEKDVEKFMHSHSPNVTGSDGGEPDVKAKRLAELSAGAKAYNRAKGYTA